MRETIFERIFSCFQIVKLLEFKKLNKKVTNKLSLIKLKGGNKNNAITAPTLDFSTDSFYPVLLCCQLGNTNGYDKRNRAVISAITFLSVVWLSPHSHRGACEFLRLKTHGREMINPR